MIPFAAYTASWSGWFASSLGYDRNWAALVGNHTPIWSTLDSWYQYQKSMLGFGLGLTSHAGYVSEPWSWLVARLRPVSVSSTTAPGQGLRGQLLLARGARDRHAGDLVGVDGGDRVLPGVVDRPPGLASGHSNK